MSAHHISYCVIIMKMDNIEKISFNGRSWNVIINFNGYLTTDKCGRPN